MDEIVKRLQENREIERAKQIVESAGYKVSKVTESVEKEKLISLYDAGSNATGHIDSIIRKNNIDYINSLQELTDEDAKKIYNDLVSRYQDEIDRYGEDNSVPYEAFDILGLHESKKSIKS